MMGNYHVRFDGGFREKVSIQTARPFTYPTMVVEVEINGQSGLQLANCAILVEMEVPALDAALWTIAKDIVEAAATHARKSRNETNSILTVSNTDCFWM